MGQLHQNPKSARNPSDENLKHKSMKVPNASFFEELHNNEDQEEDKKKTKLQRVQTALDSHFELNQLKKISAVKKRTSLIS